MIEYDRRLPFMAKKVRQYKSQAKRPAYVSAGKAASLAHATYKPWQIAIVCVALALITILAYSGVRSSDFVSMDDYGYVVENGQVHQGLTISSIEWAYTTFYASN